MCFENYYFRITIEKNKYMLPWNSPYKAIVGGAKWIGNGYINNNQDTLYYQKFNVVNKNWNHQYMANISAPALAAVLLGRANPLPTIWVSHFCPRQVLLWAWR